MWMGTLCLGLGVWLVSVALAGTSDVFKVTAFIKGSIEFLARHKPTIFLELHLNYLEERNLSAKLLIGTLIKCGYGFRWAIIRS